jgi:cell division protein FtsI (penicillin-binding protein 3)
LAEILGDKNPGQYKNLIATAHSEKNRYYRLAKDINHKQLKEIKKLPILNLGRFKGGIVIVQKTEREKPYGQMANRILGYEFDNTYIVGLEGAYDPYLKGSSGQRLMRRISGGNWIPVGFENDIEPENGKDIISTLDVNIQDAAENALKNALLSHDADHGCVIVMEVKSGDVRAIANLGKTKSGAYRESYNWAIGSSTAPGSTFKLATALILLENNYYKPTSILDTRNGIYQFYDKAISDSKPYGKISFQEAFEMSSNIFSEMVFNNFSNNGEKYLKYLGDLQLTEALNTGIIGEGKPYFIRPSDSNWKGTTLPSMAIGYSLSINPLHLLTLYNAVANQGKMLKPRFVTEIREVGKTIDEFPVVVLNNKICSARTLEWLQKMLRGVVESNHGTARNIKSHQYKIAGKTGTCKIPKETVWNSGAEQDITENKNDNRVYQASFAGYFPADDPVFSCIVVVNNPKGHYHDGAHVAAPVLREIADKLYATNIKPYKRSNNKILNYMGFPVCAYANTSNLIELSRYLGLDMKAGDASVPWAKVEARPDYIHLYPRIYEAKIIPDVSGMVLTDAFYLLENMGLKIHANGYGKVVRQSPPAGSFFHNQQKIYLVLKPS